MIIKCTFVMIMSLMLFKNSDTADQLNLVWKIHTIEEIESMLIEDNVLCVSDIVGIIYGINASTGDIIWKIPTGFVIKRTSKEGNAPCIANNIVYYGGYLHVLFAIELKTGQVIWRYGATDNIATSTEYYKGNIYFGAGSSLISVNSLSGKEIWKKQMKLNYRQKIIIDKNVLYVNTLDIKKENEDYNIEEIYNIDGILNALSSSDGKFMWKFNTNKLPLISPVTPVTNNEKVYIITSGYFGEKSYIYSFNIEDGSQNWRRKIQFVTYTPVIVGELIIVPTTCNYIVAIDMNSRIDVWKEEIEDISCNPVKINDIVIIGNKNGNIYYINGNNGSILKTIKLDCRISVIQVFENNLYVADDRGNISMISL